MASTLGRLEPFLHRTITPLLAHSQPGRPQWSAQRMGAPTALQAPPRPGGSIMAAALRLPVLFRCRRSRRSAAAVAVATTPTTTTTTATAANLAIIFWLLQRLPVLRQRLLAPPAVCRYRLRRTRRRPTTQICWAPLPSQPCHPSRLRHPCHTKRRRHRFRFRWAVAPLFIQSHRQHRVADAKRGQASCDAVSGRWAELLGEQDELIPPL